MSEKDQLLLPGTVATELELQLWKSPLAVTAPQDHLRRMAASGGYSKGTVNGAIFRERALQWVRSGVLT